jgi:hypothetical protein
VAAVAERLRLEEEFAYFTQRAEDARARLDTSGVPPPAAAVAPQAAAGADEELCVVCVDARKDRLMLPCGHLCACETCAAELVLMRPARCPICREGIRDVMRVFL